MGNSKEHRGEDRVHVALPVRLGLARGLTRDVSASGICFDVDAAYATNSDINFEIDLETDSAKMLLKCNGHIVRTEQHGSRKTVAIKIIHQHTGNQ